jgi:hypothetical protein
MGFLEIMTDSKLFRPPGGWNKAFNNEEKIKAQNKYTWLTKVQNMEPEKASQQILQTLFKSHWSSFPNNTHNN